ncbi:helix-turn-helix transcriptional regulator [Vreelandella lionensis]|jgi:transcriptional regulator with XRE-family HTH domain|uniref:helix-turn-helix transcriptional regulator n=1 Tax=Halomonadaceae TaxID=28256 RepID=UPI0009F3A3A7|nr:MULTISPECIES: helix-turn-helix domain-containing protein [Halomonas]MCP1317291.1 helix-turn-helix domain-containing protein [Halomonas sp. 707B3]
MKRKELSSVEREALLTTLATQLVREEISSGQVLRQLRRDVLGMSQTQYADLVGISRRTLSDLEAGKASPTVALLNQVFRPLGLQVGLLPRNRELRERLLSVESSTG